MDETQEARWVGLLLGDDGEAHEVGIEEYRAELLRAYETGALEQPEQTNRARRWIARDRIGSVMVQTVFAGCETMVGLPPYYVRPWSTAWLHDNGRIDHDRTRGNRADALEAHQEALEELRAELASV